MDIKAFLWVEKYRPSSIKEAILPQSFKNFFNEIAKTKDIPNLLLYSANPGSGKTSICKSIVEDTGAECLYINASLEANIDTLRNTISTFAGSKGFKKEDQNVSKQKVVLLDEIDGPNVNINVQSALRGVIEKHHKNCRFLMTCNYINKIIEPLREGRAMLFNFDMTTLEIREEVIPKIVKRCRNILEAEEVTFDSDKIDEILSVFVSKNYPNVRKIISSLQKFNMMNGCIDERIISQYGGISDELHTLVLNKKFSDARQFVLDHSYTYEELFTDFYKNLIPKFPKNSQPEAIIYSAEYQHKHLMCIDPEINFAAYLIQLIGTL